MAFALLFGGLVFWIWPFAEPGMQLQIESACWRMGACLAALWLAYPDLRNMPPWIWIALPMLILVLVKWPRLFLILIPLLILYAIFRPLLGHRAPTDN